MTQPATEKEKGNNFLTMNEQKPDSREKENGLTTFGNESDSKISINFNINNNYLLKNEIQKKGEGSIEKDGKDGMFGDGVGRAQVKPFKVSGETKGMVLKLLMIVCYSSLT